MRIAVNSVELFFDVYGSGLGGARQRAGRQAVMVALHGGPGIDHSQLVPWLTPSPTPRSSSSWTIAATAARRPVETRTLANMADDLEALRRALGLGRIVVFGMSFGGMLALTYAATYPDSVAGLIPVRRSPSNEALERALPGMHDMSSAEQREALTRLRHGTVQSAADLDRVFGALAQFYEDDPRRTPPGGFKPIADIDMLNWFFVRERATYDVRARLAPKVPLQLSSSPDASEKIGAAFRGPMRSSNASRKPNRRCSRRAAIGS